MTDQTGIAGSESHEPNKFGIRPSTDPPIDRGPKHDFNDLETMRAMIELGQPVQLNVGELMQAHLELLKANQPMTKARADALIGSESLVWFHEDDPENTDSGEVYMDGHFTAPVIDAIAFRLRNPGLWGDGE